MVYSDNAVQIDDNSGSKGADISVGNILSRSLTIGWGHMAVVMLIMVTGHVAIAVAAQALLGNPLGVSPTNLHLSTLYFSVAFCGYMLIYMLAHMLTQALVTLYIIGVATGQPMAPSDWLLRPLRCVVILVIAATIRSVILIAGLIALIVPGIMWSVATWLFLQCCVVEDLGPIASLARSMALTRSYRGKLFGYICLTALLGGICGGIIGFLRPWAYRNGAVMEAAALTVLCNSITWGFITLSSTLFYVDLRTATGGFGARLAAVFD